MKVLVDIKDDKAAFLIELMKNFPFVRKAEAFKSEKEMLKAEIMEAVEEVKLAKKGKKKLKSFDQFLNEL